jgi:hypothetical protein
MGLGVKDLCLDTMVAHNDSVVEMFIMTLTRVALAEALQRARGGGLPS